MTLTKTRSVLDHTSNVEIGDTTYVEFSSYQDDEQRLHCGVRITVDDWREMGSPEKITVAITPGDILNIDSQALEPGMRLVHVGGGSVTLAGRKDDDSGWRLEGGGGLADQAIVHSGEWSIHPDERAQV